jgi:hypothetical protein
MNPIYQKPPEVYGNYIFLKMDEISGEERPIYSSFFIKTNINQIEIILQSLIILEKNIDVLLKEENEFKKKIEKFRSSINFLGGWLNLKYKEKKDEEEIINGFLEKFNEFQKNYDIIDKQFIEIKKINNELNKEKDILLSSLNFSPGNLSFSKEKIDFEINPDKYNNLSASFNNTNSPNNSEKVYNKFYNGCKMNEEEEEEKEEEKEKEKEKEEEKEKEKEYLKCEKCKEKAVIMYKNNYYCQNCYPDTFSDSIRNEIYKRTITLNE